MKTKGDQLFETFCLARGIQLAQIPEGKRKSPDFLARIDASDFIVEVKTLEPNKEEAEVIARRARGEIVAGGGTPGERLRREIREANRQFKAYGCAELPTLLVVYNDTDCSIHCDPYSVMTAMQGLDVIDITFPLNRSESPSWESPRSGLVGRVIREGINTSTSAIAVLQVNDWTDVMLRVFHSEYARTPLPIDLLRLPGVAQFRLPVASRNSVDARWVEV